MDQKVANLKHNLRKTDTYEPNGEKWTQVDQFLAKIDYNGPETTRNISKIEAHEPQNCPKSDQNWPFRVNQKSRKTKSKRHQAASFY